MDKKMIIWINNYIDKLKSDGKALSLKKLELKKMNNSKKMFLKNIFFYFEILKVRCRYE